MLLAGVRSKRFSAQLSSRYGSTEKGGEVSMGSFPVVSERSVHTNRGAGTSLPAVASEQMVASVLRGQGAERAVGYLPVCPGNARRSARRWKSARRGRRIRSTSVVSPRCCAGGKISAFASCICMYRVPWSSRGRGSSSLLGFRATPIVSCVFLRAMLPIARVLRFAKSAVPRMFCAPSTWCISRRIASTPWCTVSRKRFGFVRVSVSSRRPFLQTVSSKCGVAA